MLLGGLSSGSRNKIKQLESQKVTEAASSEKPTLEELRKSGLISSKRPRGMDSVGVTGGGEGILALFQLDERSSSRARTSVLSLRAHSSQNCTLAMSS